MLREGHAKPTPPRKKPSQTPSAGQSTVGQAKPGNGSDESENEDYVPVPQYKEAFSDAIQDAFDKMTLSRATSKEGMYSLKIWDTSLLNCIVWYLLWKGK